MTNIIRLLHFLLIIAVTSSCVNKSPDQDYSSIAKLIKQDSSLIEVHKRAQNLVASGFNAGTVYQEVWIRDFNTFIEVSCDVLPHDLVKEKLLTFFKFQADDGNIIDGYVPVEQAGVGYKYRYTELAPEFAGHKNTVETDQESSLVQAVWKYIQKTKDDSILDEKINGLTIVNRLDFAMTYLTDHRLDEKFGLIWGATTADWGDVQPEHNWGVELDENSHICIDIYDNAMFIIALDQLIEMLTDQKRKEHWSLIKDEIHNNVRIHLWDSVASKFIPHKYIAESPFPLDFDENIIHFHGGTAIAIEAGLLNKSEIAVVNKQMLANLSASGAPSIGLTVYPPYPEGFFKNKSMYPYGYQNGGDWTWFGARMIRQLANYGFGKEAYEEIQPMIDRVLINDGFFEWYTLDGKPTGAGKFRGSAGVLATAIEALWTWAKDYN